MLLRVYGIIRPDLTATINTNASTSKSPLEKEQEVSEQHNPERARPEEEEQDEQPAQELQERKHEGNSEVISAEWAQMTPDDDRQHIPDISLLNAVDIDDVSTSSLSDDEDFETDSYPPPPGGPYFAKVVMLRKELLRLEQQAKEPSNLRVRRRQSRISKRINRSR